MIRVEVNLRLEGKNIMNERKPGIVGGIGPEATVDLFDKIINQTPAQIDQDHIQVLIFNNPKIPSRYEAIKKDGESPGPYVAESAQKLESMGADFLAIASNLTHVYYNETQSAVDIPVINMIESVSQYAKEREGVSKVGILAPTPTLQASLYQKEFRQMGLEPISLDSDQNEDLVDESIYGKDGIKSGNIKDNREPLAQAAKLLSKEGSDIIVLACTELPLAFNKIENMPNDKIVDANSIFARKIVHEAKMSED